VLLKLNNNGLLIKMRNVANTSIKLCLLLLLSCNVSKALADETKSKLQWHGFISQGVIDVDGSDFVNDDGDLSTELTEVGLNTNYQLSDDLRFAVQAVYLNGGNRFHSGARIDYMLIDWSVYNSIDWQANIYFGRFKNNHWLYSSTRDVPFARPSIVLPQSVYFDGFRDIAVGGDGVAFKISHNDDVYGEFDFNFSYGTSPIPDTQQKILLSESALGDVKQDIDLQSSFYWQPSFSQWRFGLSLLNAEFSYSENRAYDNFASGDFTFQFYTMNALYEGEKWEFSGEIYQERFVVEGFYVPQFHADDIGQGYYIQSRYKMNDKLTFLARAEHFYLNKEDKKGKQLERNTAGQIPGYFGYHSDATLGLSYDFSSDIKLRVEHHWMRGAARLTPIVLPNTQLNNSEYWQMWAVQLMYWF